MHWFWVLGQTNKKWKIKEKDVFILTCSEVFSYGFFCPAAFLHFLNVFLPIDQYINTQIENKDYCHVKYGYLLKY